MSRTSRSVPIQRETKSQEIGSRQGIAAAFFWRTELQDPTRCLIGG